MNEYNKKKFILLWLGEFLSVIGSGITGFAMGVSFYQSTGKASYYSFITLATVGPSILIRPLAGALADKYSRRSLMLIGNFLAGFGVILIAVLFHFHQGSITIGQVCACMTLSSIGTGISLPAYMSSITLLIPEEFYAVASGMIQISASGQYLISPLLAGILLSALSLAQIVLIDASTFLVVFLIVLWIKLPLKVADVEDAKEPLLQKVKKGVAYLFRHKQNLMLAITGMCTNFFMGFLIVLIGPMILSFSNAKMLGIGESVSAIGMVAGSVLVMTRKLPEKLYKAVFFYVFLMGAGYALVGVRENYVCIIAACIVFFYSIPYINTYTDVIYRKTIDKKMQGRVYAIQGAMAQIGYVLSYSFAGVLADYVFEPMFRMDGCLYHTIGKIIGTGQGRGIGFMFILSGIAILLIGLFFWCRIKKYSIEDKMEELA